MSKMNQMPIDKCVAINDNNPAITYATDKCMQCGMCATTCNQQIGIRNYYDLNKTGGDAICIHCGQCTVSCPFGVIKEVDDTERVRQALLQPGKTVVVSTSPAVRAALGEEFGMEMGSFVEGKMVALLRKLGFNYVFDTDFAADLTIMEEASELVERITKGHKPLPMFTSCCPAWVKFAEYFYPQLLPNLSSAKSPISMIGPMIKTYFAAKANIDPADIVHVALTPCTAKKFEILRPELNDGIKAAGHPELADTDIVITTREVARWAKEAGIDFPSLEDDTYDRLLGESTGAGVIFGNTGGVMEAALRTAYKLITGQDAPAALFALEAVRGFEGIKEATLNIGGMDINVAVIYGTQNARNFIDKMADSPKQYHFIEVMTCPGGCIGGGGQPINLRMNKDKLKEARAKALYRSDESKTLRSSYENPEIKAIYADFLGKPLSEKSEELLHTTYTDRSKDLGE